MVYSRKESYVERKVTTWARQQGLLPLKLTPVGEAGWPDHFYLFLYPAIAFIEFKAPGKKPRPLQEVRIAELRRRGYPVAVIDNVESAVDFLRETMSPNARSSKASITALPRNG